MSSSRRLLAVFAFLAAVGVLALSLAGGMGGCGEKKAIPFGKDKTKEEAGNEEGDADGGKTEGFRGIAFVKDDHIYLADEKSEVLRRLTTRESGYEDLAFSPSGARLAATKVEGDAMPQLLVIDAESGKEEEISWTNPDYSGAWTEAGVDPWFGTMSWESEEVLYLNAVRSVEGEFRNYVVRYDLSAPSVEIIEEDAANPALSPDGKRLAYVRKPAEWEEVGVGAWGNLSPGDLVVRELSDGATTKISVRWDGANRGYVFDAAFSPDGEHMAVDCFDEPDTELYYIDLEGSILFALDMVGPSGKISHPGFSPDGEHVIACIQFRDTPEGPWEYTVIIRPVTGNMPEGVDIAGAMNPAWSPAE